MEHSFKHRASLLIALVFALCLCSTPVCGETVDRVVAEVDDQIITLTDLNWFIRWRGFQVPEAGQERESFLIEVLNQLINQRLVVKESAKTPFAAAAKAEVDDFFNRYLEQFPTQQDFQSRLSDLGMSESDIRAIIRRQIAVNKFIQYRFEPFVIVLPDDIQEYYQDEFVPELNNDGQPVPPLSLVQETIRQILSVRRTTDRLENWLQSARSRAQIREMMFRSPLGMPNLPPEFGNSIEMTEEPFAKPPSSNR
jgi:uncharacterized protein YjiS (DUF1127 family)